MKSLSYTLLAGLLSGFTQAPPLQVPRLLASYETTPLPFGLHESDDPAIWYHPEQPHQSLVLGTSKFEAEKEQGYGGLGVYGLNGVETRFLPGDRLNNIDMFGNRCSTQGCTGGLAIASNRTIDGISLFQVSSAKVGELATLPLLDEAQKPLKVYGICTGFVNGKSLALVTTKKGQAMLFDIQGLPDGTLLSPQPITAHLIKTIDLAALITPSQDQFVRTIVEKGARTNGELDDLEKKLRDRFALEGCTYDAPRQRWVVGMENFGLWSVPQDSTETPTVLLQVQGSWTDIDQWGQDPTLPRITDDLEGVDVFTYGGSDYLMFSAQGISEFGLYSLSERRYMGNFALSFNDKDPVTNTDGLAVKSLPMGPEFPRGILVVHDDSNESPTGTLEGANYKIVDLKKIMDQFGL